MVTFREIRTHEIHVRHIPPEKWWHRAKWELLKEYISRSTEIVVPVGFITDGASIPWFLRWRFSPTGDYFGAAILHDYIIVTENDWDKANIEFDKELKALNISDITRKLMVFFVKVWKAVSKYIPKRFITR